MIDPLILLAFLPVSLALNLTPGADMLFCAGQGMRGGAVPAIAASAGVALGGVIHVVIAALGLAALINSAPWIYEMIRWMGAAYLLWLAWSSLRGPPDWATQVIGLSVWRAFLQGLLVNLANPKVILFVLALLPPFVVPDRPALGQFLVLGAVLSFGGFIVNGFAGVLAARAGRAISGRTRTANAIRFVSAGIFAALAVALILPERN